MASARDDYEVFEFGDVVFERGATLRGARLTYKTYGAFSAAKDNAIISPTWYSGRHWENEWLIGEGIALDPMAASPAAGLTTRTRGYRRGVQGAPRELGWTKDLSG